MAEFESLEPCCSKLCSIPERCRQLDIIHISFHIIHLQVRLTQYTKFQLTLYLVPQDHELKKQYLALLPPQQIIEICLTFDIHVPPYVKSTIWPLDINAAIAALRRTTPEPSIGESSKVNATPAMGSLTAADSASPSDEPAKNPDEPQPPDKSTFTPLQSGGQVNTQTPTSQPPYPFQPYGFPQPQAGYPHASYYGHPPTGFPPYSSPYPYQQFQHPNPSSTSSQPNPLPYPQPQDSFRDQPSADDLPSYEEMIVEALTTSGDSEGCAPKELFTWMASRYPLQSNFRPSASQALQKAFKRGRFEKSRNGKYRLNATWEGGNVGPLPSAHALNLTQA
jgi:linker histone H1 and H5 family